MTHEWAQLLGDILTCNKLMITKLKKFLGLCEHFVLLQNVWIKILDGKYLENSDKQQQTPLCEEILSWTMDEFTHLPKPYLLLLATCDEKSLGKW